VRIVNLAEAKAHLCELVAVAAAGEPVCILRRGKPVALLVPAQGKRRRIEAARLRAVTETMPGQQEPAREFVRPCAMTIGY
jgi:prevent-host-death family protein